LDSFVLLIPIFTALCWACVPYIFTKVQQHIGVNQLNVDRLIFASIFLGLTLVLKPTSFEVSSQQIILLVLSGIIGLSIGDYFLYSSFRKVGPRYSMIMMSLAPAFSCVGARFIFGEKLGVMSFIGIVLTIIGIIIVISNQNKNPENKSEKIKLKNLSSGLFAALCQAIGLLCVKGAFLRGEIDSILATFIRLSTAGILLMLWLIILKKYKNPFVLYKADKPVFKLVLAGVLIGPVLGITSSVLSVNYISVSIAQTLFATSPIFMLPISHFLFHDKVTFGAIIGVLVAITGVAFLFIF